MYYDQDVTATVFDKFLMTASVTKDNNTVTYDREDFDKIIRMKISILN